YQFVEALVVGISSDDYVYTVEIAEKLRKLGLRIETDIIGRNIENNIEYAIQHNIPFLIILNSVEPQDSKVLLQNLESGEKQNLELNEVVKKVRNS
ncbi:MAG: ATP phosphoribosyltransferase regulatory subunit, partial [Okeania sp. SIO3H1]|nr:ATP phosphoribosyltransferase regulatory subunit [Okeania sp. SIO3H1]